MARIMIWANYRRGPSVAVPAPFDDNSSPYWWYDRIASWANGWAVNGGTDVLFPNPVKGQSGAYRTGDGYNPFDDYDIGSKDQLGRKPTRFGDVDQLRRAVAICRANGIAVHIDHVMHQRMGGKAGVYRYIGSDGKTLNGRFPKDPGCFSPSGPNDKIPPYVPVDPVPDQPDNFPFGNPLAPVNSVPAGYVWSGLIEAGDWLFRTLGVQGARLDDMKGTNVGFIKAFMTSSAMKGKFFFGEYASGNRDDTDWWVSQVDGLASTIDFDWHYNAAEPMCNNAGAGTFYMGRLKGRGMIATNPMRAIPFVESMDSDTDGFATIVDNKILAYALLLGGEGLPMIYIRDYLQEPDCYGLKPEIDNLMWCHQNLAHGDTVARHGDDKVFVFERTGDPGLIVTLNNDVWNPAWHTVTVQTNFGPNMQLNDYSGRNSQNEWTDKNGVVTLGIPPGPNGTGYGFWSKAGLGKPNEVKSFSCTQEFFGAADLDIPPATNGTVLVGRVWAAAGTDMHVSLTADRTNWTPDSTIVFQVLGLDQAPVIGGTMGLSSKGADVTNKTVATGWHTIWLLCAVMPDGGSPYSVKITYTAPKHLATEDFETS